MRSTETNNATGSHLTANASAVTIECRPPGPVTIQHLARLGVRDMGTSNPHGVPISKESTITNGRGGW